MINIFSAVFGSKIGNKPVPIDLKIAADITLIGTANEMGSFPSTPISFWIPGTNISTNATGYIPIYNEVLGVVGFPKQKPIVNYNESETSTIVGMLDDPYDGSLWPAYEIRAYVNPNINLSNTLIFNPKVLAIADIKVLKQELILHSTDVKLESDGRLSCPIGFNCEFTRERSINIPAISVKFVIEVKPKNGSTTSIIVKTFSVSPKSL